MIALITNIAIKVTKNVKTISDTKTKYQNIEGKTIEVLITNTTMTTIMTMIVEEDITIECSKINSKEKIDNTDKVDTITTEDKMINICVTEKDLHLDQDKSIVIERKERALKDLDQDQDLLI